MDFETPDRCNQPVLQALAPFESVQSWQQGKVLFRDGQSPEGVFVLLAGEVDLVFASRAGKEKTLRIAVPGQILGLSSLVSGRPHEYTATIQSHSTVTGYVEKDKLLAVLNQDPRLWFSVLQILSGDIQSCYDRMKALAEVPAHR
jgi:CRP/FNR family transcriptional regulator